MESIKTRRLLNKVALITGAGSGFGRATSLRFAREGASVISIDKNGTTAEETVKLIEKEVGGKNLAFECDISNISDIKSAVKLVYENFPRLDILINNAGVGNTSMGVLYHISEKVWDDLMNVNLRGTWLMSREFIKKMKKQEIIGELRGKIINVSSLAGKLPSSPLGVYSISKAGINAMTQILAQELGPHKITVNGVCPGFHVTGIYLNDPNLVKIASEMWSGKICLERIGTAEDVSNVLFFLASEDSNYMTGQSLNCGGGCYFS
ncbi:MAG: SDR family oxidoreductase [Candidatus Lokiarchaeota archaeon]|nr:SDR family oxidoreductase [Candidatus Lokiarchaeota archaeon]